MENKMSSAEFLKINFRKYLHFFPPLISFIIKSLYLNQTLCWWRAVKFLFLYPFVKFFEFLFLYLKCIFCAKVGNHWCNQDLIRWTVYCEVTACNFRVFLGDFNKAFIGWVNLLGPLLNKLNVTRISIGEYGGRNCSNLLCRSSTRCILNYRLMLCILICFKQCNFIGL